MSNSAMYPGAAPRTDAAKQASVTPGEGSLDPNAFRSGDPRALERVYRAYVDQVAVLIRRGFVYSRGKVAAVPGVADPQTQCDLIQETFSRLFAERARQAYDPAHPLRPYLLRIAKNLMIDRLRRSGREVSPSDCAAGASLGDIDEILDSDQPLPDEDPASLAHFNRQREATRNWAAALPEELRAVYRFRYEQAMGQEQTAAGLGISRRRVRTLEGRLRRLLRKHLKKKRLWP